MARLEAPICCQGVVEVHDHQILPIYFNEYFSLPFLGYLNDEKITQTHA